MRVPVLGACYAVSVWCGECVQSACYSVALCALLWLEGGFCFACSLVGEPLWQLKRIRENGAQRVYDTVLRRKTAIHTEIDGAPVRRRVRSGRFSPHAHTYTRARTHTPTPRQHTHKSTHSHAHSHGIWIWLCVGLQQISIFPPIVVTTTPPASTSSSVCVAVCECVCILCVSVCCRRQHSLSTSSALNVLPSSSAYFVLHKNNYLESVLACISVSFMIRIWCNVLIQKKNYVYAI